MGSGARSTREREARNTHCTANAGTSVMKVEASGDQSGPTAIVNARTIAPRRYRGSAHCTSATSPPKASSALATWMAVIDRGNTSATGAARASWPTSVIETQLLNPSTPWSTRRNNVSRYDQSSLRGMERAP